MLGILGGSKVLVYLFIGTLLIGTVSTTYYMWKKSIRQEALFMYNQKQLEQTIIDQEKFIKLQTIARINAERALKNLESQNQKLIEQLDSINEYLDSSEAKESDRPSSVVIKRTIEQLIKNSK